MAGRDDRNEERLSENLAHYIVSPAVLKKLNEASDKTTDSKAGSDTEPPCVATIVELNIDYSPDIDEAKAAAVALLREERIADERIDGESSDYNIFIDLTRDELSAIEKRVRAADTSPIFRIWPDQPLSPLIHRSVRTIKADACFTVYKSSGAEIVWAVADSGVDGTHFHFQRHQTTLLPGSLRHRDFTVKPTEDGSPLVDHYGHGTHVAGIIAGETRVLDAVEGEAFSRGDLPDDDAHGKLVIRLASRQVSEKQEAGEGGPAKRKIETEVDSLPCSLAGMAPLAKIMSLKVLDDDGNGSTRNLIAALEYVEKINSHGRLIRVHGVNLSVGYTFDAEQYAAGHSPLCTAVNRLVRSGVVVVAAAGNDGAALIAPEGSARSKRIGLGQSINDPGNAEEAITVGATHGEEPHRYGVSYFSSRGPTADGRMKPDLVAPGERILSCVPSSSVKADNLLDSLPDDQPLPDDAALYRVLSGTSMAAPHVSGSIAALMSVRREFRGEAQKVKEIFVNSCTDLRRSRDFQGAGLIDLMRAIQSI